MNHKIKHTGIWILILLFITASLPTPTRGADKRGITEMDLFKFVWIADPQISPDGSRIVFMRVWVNQKPERYDSALWMVPTNGGAPRQLTAGPRDSTPRWSPDGKQLAFIRSAEKEGRPQPPQIYLMTFDGGEAQPVTDVPNGAGGIEWSPDGKTILFASGEDASKKAQDKDKSNPEAGVMKEKEKTPEHVSDVRVINRATYRFNGPGYLNARIHSHIWTVSVPTASGEMPKPKQVTKGDFDEGNPSWSPDGSRIYFVANRVLESY
jgi:Tol biopolymer transport system component